MSVNVNDARSGEKRRSSKAGKGDTRGRLFIVFSSRGSAEDVLVTVGEGNLLLSGLIFG